MDSHFTSRVRTGVGFNIRVKIDTPNSIARFHEMIHSAGKILVCFIAIVYFFAKGKKKKKKCIPKVLGCSIHGCNQLFTITFSLQ